MLIAIDEAIVKELIIALENASFLRESKEDIKEAGEYLIASPCIIIRKSWLSVSRIKPAPNETDVLVRIRRSDLDAFLHKGRIEAKY